MKRNAFLWLVAAIALPSCALMPAKIYAQQPSENIYAQHLIDDTLKKHPEVVTLVMHVTPPKSTENVIIASNIGRIGKKADADDMRVIETGKPNIGPNPAGDRYEVELPFRTTPAGRAQ